MKLAHASAIYAAPIPLRIVLALTFIWAGLGKFIHEVPVQGEEAALLANMGYDFSNATPATPAAPTDTTETDNAPQPANQPATQADGWPDDQFEDEPATPAGTPDNEPAPTADTPATDSNATALPPLLALAQQPASDRAIEPTDTAAAAQPTPPAYTAADFPEPVEVRSLYNLSILTYRAAHPTPTADGTTPTPIWPDWAARDDWPRYMAWAAAAAELAAGVLIAIGLLTRLSAVTLAAIMLTAMWLTQLGPAIQSGDTLLGFLPNHGIWDTEAWRPLLWQFALFGAAVALACTGPGAVAIDRVPNDRDADDDDDDE